MKKKIQKGFSLIELMIVIAIIAILAAIAIPMYSNYTVRANIASEISRVGGLKAEISEDISKKNAVAAVDGHVADLNVDYDASGAIGIGVQSNGEAATDYQNATYFIKLAPSYSTSAGSITWTCTASGTDFTQSKLPSKCTLVSDAKITGGYLNH